MAKKGFIIALILTLVTNTIFVAATSADSITIEAESYTRQNGCIAISDVLVMSSLGDATYSIEVTDGGRYLMEMKAKAENDTFINISLNGEALANAPIRYSNDYMDNFVYVNLPEGEHQMKLFIAGDAVTMDRITIAKVTDDRSTDTAFLDALNTAKNEAGVLTAFETYAPLLGIDFESITQDVDYKKAVYMNMANRGFDDVEEALETLIDITEKEKSDPIIRLQKDGEWVKEISSGNMSIVIDNSKIGDRPTFGAIYEDGESNKLIAAEKAVETNGKYIVNFGNVTVNESDQISWRVFFFDDLETIRPYEPYGVYKELYVATTGNDTYDGTEDKPFATIGKAKEVAESLSENMSGDIIINIAAGEYFIAETETFDADNSGKNGFDIIYRGAENGETVISGGKKVEEWSEGDNGIWSASVDADVADVRNLYINGIAAYRSRSNFRYTYLEDYDDTSTSNDKDGFVTSTTGGFPNLQKPQYAETVWEIKWRCQRLPVRSIQAVGENTVVLFDKAGLYDSTKIPGLKIGVGEEYYIENDLSLLDTPGEFYYDKDDKRIYYYPYPEEDMKTVQAVVAVTEGLIKINGTKATKVSNLVFDNISFKYGAWNHVSTYGLVGQQSDSFYNHIMKDGRRLMLMLSQFAMNYAEDIKIKNCEFSSLGSAAVSMKDGVEDVLFEGNVIKDISGTGIIIGRFEHSDEDITSAMEICRDIDIKNNVLRRVATEYRQNAAISVYYENAINIEHNDILGTPYSAISVGWGWEDLAQTSKLCRNLSVTNNKVVDVLGTLQDGGNIYNLGSNYEAKIAGNYLAKNNEGFYPGIYLDAGSSYLNVHDNLVLDNADFFLFIQRQCDDTIDYKARYNKVYNNYSDTVTFNQSGTITSDTNEIADAIQAYADGVLIEAAQSIFDAAGLETEYSSLIDGVSAPEYIREYIKMTPKGEFIDGMRIECEDYTDVSGTINSYENILGIHTGCTLEYSVYVGNAGKYSLSFVGGRADPSITSVLLGININDGEETYTSTFTHSVSAGVYEEVLLGEIHLNSGENIIALKTVNNSIMGDYMVISQIE
ncbi:MAG: right-handed parallel beta-helix repeat-containing protein [Clostridia bacterium]|nr:right-handed parallel beta-helix repeat-containing protein [Clostridia bacterium]